VSTYYFLFCAACKLLSELQQCILYGEDSEASFIKAQNHRTAEIAWDFCGSSGPTPLLTQGHLQPAAQDYVQTAFEYHQEWRLHNLSGQPVPLVKKFKKLTLV